MQFDVNTIAMGKGLVRIWIVFSLVYIVYDRWDHFKQSELDKAYQQGTSDAVTRVIDEAAKCQAFEIFAGEKRTQLVGVSCLNQGGMLRAQAPSMPPPVASSQGGEYTIRPAPPPQ